MTDFLILFSLILSTGTSLFVLFDNLKQDKERRMVKEAIALAEFWERTRIHEVRRLADEDHKASQAKVAARNWKDRLDRFPGSNKSFFGRQYGNGDWKKELDSLLSDGLDITTQSEDLRTLVSVVTDDLNYNEWCVTEAANPSLPHDRSISLAFAQNYIQPNKACLAHLQGLITEQDREALDASTPQAVNSSRPKGRL